jgi:hypothetical protein
VEYVEPRLGAAKQEKPCYGNVRAGGRTNYRKMGGQCLAPTILGGFALTCAWVGCAGR